MIEAWIERWADTDAIAISFEGDDVTYRRLADRIGSTAAGLAAAGIEPGDRVLYCGLNRVELFELLFACARLGAVLCPLNNRLAPAEAAIQIEDCDPALLVAADGFGSLLAAATDRPWRDLDLDPFPDGTAPAAVGTADDPVLMVYTSGTTGQPKGAVLSQDAMTHTVLNGVDHQDLTSEDCIIAPLPTFHVGGINVQTMPTLHAGGRVVLHRRFDPDAILTDLVAQRPTQTLLVPAMLQAVAGHPRFATTDLGSLHGINSGSSIVPEADMAPFFDRGIPVGQVYGTTETGPTAVVLRYDEGAERMGSCGRPARYSEVRVVADDGRDAEPGTDGELWIRGPNLFSGYWRNEAATIEAFTDGWYRTGDVGQRDGDGYLYITDRLTDVVISGGENVYPAEVEAVLSGHPDVAEIAVVGRPDPRWGETPVAVVVAADGRRPTIEGLRAWCQGRLAPFKQPRELHLVDALPRTALGKVTKHVLRSQL